MGIKIGHAAFKVKDMAATLAFYADALGIHKAFSVERDGQPAFEYLKVADGQYIELFYGGDGTPPAGALIHLCFEVDDIHAAAAKIEAAGYPLDVPIRKGLSGSLLCFTKDPDGIPIELMQITPDSLQANA
jgi:catechol 2,3-dioxygenase-like lactoylglutathione lyase family enzyme